MFLKKNERIDFGLLLKIYATKHRICIWIFKQNQNQNQPTSEQKSFSTVPSIEQQTGSKSGKECVNAVYCHPASVQFSSVSQSCLTLCNPMNRSMPGLPVQHQLPESTQIHVHWVNDAIQPSHSLSSTSPLALNLSQPQGLFKWVNTLHQVAKVLEYQLQHQSFQWTPRTDLLQRDWRLAGSPWISLQSKGLSRVFSDTTVQKHQYFGA